MPAVVVKRNSEKSPRTTARLFFVGAGGVGDARMKRGRLLRPGTERGA